MSRLSEKEGRFKIGRKISSKLNSMLLCLTRYRFRSRTGYLSFSNSEVRTQSQLSAKLSGGTDTVACSVLCTKYLCVVLYSRGISLYFTSYVPYRFLSHLYAVYSRFYKMLHWINWIVLLSLEPLAGELKYASVVWSAAGAWAGRVSNV